MNTSSHKQIGRAKEIAALIRKRADDFRCAKLGSDFRVDEFEFQLLVANRNTVYRVCADRTWYAKLPSRDGSLRTEHEQAGTGVIARVHDAVPNCFPLKDVAFDVGEGIIVTEEVPGPHMHTQLYQSLPGMLVRRHHWILDAYESLGEVLAVFHDSVSESSPETTRITTKQEFDEVADYLPESEFDPRLRAILENADGIAEDVGFAHGNLRRENIILTPDRMVGVIDFEDSGRGSRYDDLSKLCTGMLLTKTAKVFPWQPVYRALGAMLNGYHRRTPLDQRSLLRHSAIRVATQFALSFTKKQQSVARIPVSQRKTRQLLLSLLTAADHGSLESVDRRMAMAEP